MAWVMQVQQNHNTKKWPWLSTNIYHLFQRCPCKMMSKTSEAGIHMYMMKAHELMGVWGCRGREEILFFFISCPLLTNTVRGITWPFMLFSCIQFLFVCGCRTKGASPFKTHSTGWVAFSYCPPKRLRSNHFSFLEYSSSMDGLIKGWRRLLCPKKCEKLQIIITHV